jgi:hypothetical protein
MKEGVGGIEVVAGDATTNQPNVGAAVDQSSPGRDRSGFNARRDQQSFSIHEQVEHTTVFNRNKSAPKVTCALPRVSR